MADPLGIAKDADDLISAALEHKDFAMAGTLFNDTPFTWESVDQFGGPIEHYQSKLPHGFAEFNPILPGGTPRDSNPGWKHAPDPHVEPYNPGVENSLRGALDLFVVQGSSHVYNFKQAGGFEVTVSFHCKEIETTLVLYMNHWQYASDDVHRLVGGMIAGPSPYIKHHDGSKVTDEEMNWSVWRTIRTSPKIDQETRVGFSDGNQKHLKAPFASDNEKGTLVLSFTAAENTEFKLSTRGMS